MTSAGYELRVEAASRRDLEGAKNRNGGTAVLCACSKYACLSRHMSGLFWASFGLLRRTYRPVAIAIAAV